MDFVNIQFLLTNKFPGSKKYLEIPDKTLFVKNCFSYFFLAKISWNWMIAILKQEEKV